MDELDGNPLHKALMSNFRREYDLACQRSYLIAIPTSDSLEDLAIDRTLVYSHILMPSKLLKMHYTSLQAGSSNDIEIEGKKILYHLDKKRPMNKLEVNILAEEIGYNAQNKEYKTLLIDRPLVVPTSKQILRSFLSPIAANRLSRRQKAPRSLKDHDDCSKYLEYLSQQVTTQFEIEVKRLQSNYMILSRYLDDAAKRMRDLAENYVIKYEAELGAQGNPICDSVKRAIRISVETYIVHLLHGKLMASIYSLHEKDDEILTKNFGQIRESRLSVCQLGAQLAYADFTPSTELIAELKRLPLLQSPLAAISCLVRIIGHITECLSASVRFKHLLGETQPGDGLTSICSDDLIASFVYSLAQVQPPNLYSMAKYLETFGWSSAARDQAAYDAATFQIVIQYVYSQSTSNIKQEERRHRNSRRSSALSIASGVSRSDLAIGHKGSPSSVSQLSTGKTSHILKSLPSAIEQLASFTDSLDSQDSSAVENTSSSPNSVATDVIRADWELV